ncbi:hypothetical protein ACWKSP_26310 [Micromonosporaceae bacterium Da 78-11]
MTDSGEYDFRPGDIWVDTSLRGAHEDGVHWHVRSDANGDPELFEPNGPGLVPASELHLIQGGMRLISRDDEAGAR